MRSQRSIEESRLALANMYRSETEQYREELQKRRQTPAKRFEQLKERADEIRREKAAFDSEYTKIQDERRWHDNCDEVRAAESKVMSYQIALDHQRQMAEREFNEIEEHKRDQQYEELMKGDMERSRQRDIRDRERQRELVAQTKVALEEQLAETATIKEQAAAMHEREESALKAIWELDQEEESLKRRRLILKEKRRAREDADYNAFWKKKHAEEYQKELELDLDFIRSVVEREAAEAADEQARAGLAKEEAHRYRAHLMKQLEKDRIDSGELDRLIKQEQERDWAKRTAVWDREAAARKKLMDEACADWRMRMQAEADAITELKADKERELAEVGEEMKRVAEDETREAERRKEKQQTVKKELESQIREQNEERAAIRRHEVEEAEQREAEQLRLLQRQEATVAEARTRMAEAQDVLNRDRAQYAKPEGFRPRPKKQWY